MPRIFARLRTRLLISYVLVLLLTLVVIGVALVFVLRSMPMLTEATSLRLYNLLQQIETVQDQQGDIIAERGPTLAQRRILNGLANRLRMRLILADAHGAVSFDSRRNYTVGSQLDLDVKPYTPPDLFVDAQAIAARRGILRNPDDSEWVFVGQTPDPARPEKQLFIVAIKAPRLLSPMEAFQYYAPDFARPLFQAGLIGLIFAFIMSAIVARSVARPLQDLAKAAVAVARGHLDHRVPARGPREVRTLAESFNQMAAQVQETQQMQRDFLANVTHDLRTPLTSIQGFSQAIIEGVASDPAAAQRAAKIIHDETGRLNRMVQELLELARIEAGRLNMTRHTIRLHEVLNAVGERLMPHAQEKGLALVLDIAPLPAIAGDGDRLVQVYTNLIDNALKHTPSGGIVTLRAMQQDGGALVQVSDTGEGIPAADLPHVFDRFYQVDKSRQRAQREGTGLGLAIAKGVMDAHGGRIWVESKEGVGTTFSTWFPLPASDSTTITARRRSGLFKPPLPKAATER